MKVPCRCMQVDIFAQSLWLCISLSKSDAWLKKATKCSKKYVSIVGNEFAIFHLFVLASSVSVCFNLFVLFTFFVYF